MFVLLVFKFCNDTFIIIISRLLFCIFFLHWNCTSPILSDLLSLRATAHQAITLTSTLKLWLSKSFIKCMFNVLWYSINLEYICQWTKFYLILLTDTIKCFIILVRKIYIIFKFICIILSYFYLVNKFCKIFCFSHKIKEWYYEIT